MLQRIQPTIPPYLYYLSVVSVIGLTLALGGLFALPSYNSLLYFGLILLLALLATFATTEVPNMTFEVGSAVAIAAVPLFGPFGAALISALATVAAWAFRTGRENWKRSREQLFFNAGMQSVAAFASGWTYVGLIMLTGASTAPEYLLIWVLSAVVYDQSNFWMLMVIVRLKQGPSFNPTAVWQENRWAMSLNIALLTIGGGVLAFSATTFGWSGLLVFYLPVVLSAYAFRLYVSKMTSHMDNLEEIIAERTSEIATLMSEKDAFLAVLTHDMKSPLTSIGMYGDLITQNPEVVATQPELTKMLLYSQQSLLEIVNNILDLENLQAGGSLQLQKSMFDLQWALQLAVGALQAQADHKRIQLEMRTNGIEPLVVFADKQQIERVINNLVSNAIKYTPDEGEVAVSVTAKAGEAHVTVVDSGYGIPASELPHIFERYWRVDKHRNKAAGTGLGLSIAKAIVEAHEGQIQVESVDGEGSTFTFTLPLVVGESMRRYTPIMDEVPVRV